MFFTIKVNNRAHLRMVVKWRRVNRRRIRSTRTAKKRKMRSKMVVAARTKPTSHLPLIWLRNRRRLNLHKIIVSTSLLCFDMIMKSSEWFCRNLSQVLPWFVLGPTGLLRGCSYSWYLLSTASLDWLCKADRLGAWWVDCTPQCCQHWGRGSIPRLTDNMYRVIGTPQTFCLAFLRYSILL